MIQIDIPGRRPLQIEHLVLDYNGTIAVDGQISEATSALLTQLKDMVKIYILTADTYGTAASQCHHLNVVLKTFPRENAGDSKKEIVADLSGGICCIGNGFNDISMCQMADLSIAVLSQEGICTALVMHCDVLVTSPKDALSLLLKPDRLRATLRN